MLQATIAHVDDAEQAARSFRLSELPIDLEFKALYHEISPGDAEVLLLYDSSRFVGARNP